MILQADILNKIHDEILLRYPEEACGVITEDDFIPMENTHETPLVAFRLESSTLLPYLGKIKGIAHSHCRDVRKPEVFDTRTPSLEDIENQKLAGVPYYIFATEGQTVSTPLILPRVKNNILLGRPFIWFINDCYTLVQDYYLFNLGISLPDHKADRDYKELKDFNNIFDSYVSEYDFIESSNLKDLKNGDLFLLDNAGGINNHLGIYHEGKILHQGMTSVEVPFEYFRGRLKKRFIYVG